MFFTPAYAQGVGFAGNELTQMMVPLVIVFAIMYFMVLRPQQRRQKEHQETLKKLRRGDSVITSGGLVGKVTKVLDDDQVEIEIADGVRVRQIRGMVAEVRAKGEPVKDDAAAKQG